MELFPQDKFINWEAIYSTFPLLNEEDTVRKVAQLRLELVRELNDPYMDEKEHDALENTIEYIDTNLRRIKQLKSYLKSMQEIPQNQRGTKSGFGLFALNVRRMAPEGVNMYHNFRYLLEEHSDLNESIDSDSDKSYSSDD